jgi:hypothetical protein
MYNFLADPDSILQRLTFLISYCEPRICEIRMLTVSLRSFTCSTNAAICEPLSQTAIVALSVVSAAVGAEAHPLTPYLKLALDHA